jgi:hypothetical protein
MMTREEAGVLEFLGRNGTVTIADLGTHYPPEWYCRVTAVLEWFGFVTVYHDANGNPLVLQITDKGLEYLGGRRLGRRCQVGN